jgi:hypothetical protein
MLLNAILPAMNRHGIIPIRSLLLALLSTALAFDSAQARSAKEILADAKGVDISVCDPSAGPFSLDITNAFLPFPEGAQWILSNTREKVQITVLSDTEKVAGVTTRVVEEREWEDGELVEVSRNFVAQAPDGSVCYFGEDVDDYADGKVSGHDGGWRAGVKGARPGMLMPGKPVVGTSHQQEASPGEAEDYGVIVGVGEKVETPAGTFSDTLSTIDVNPLENEQDPKHYARGVGMIVDEDLKLTGYKMP